MNRLFAPIVTRASLQNGDVPLTSNALSLLFGGRPTGSGIRVTRKNATALSSVYRALTLKSGAIAASPIAAHDRLTDEVQALPLLQSPHGLLTMYEYVEMIVLHLETAGDHFAVDVSPHVGDFFWPLVDQQHHERNLGMILRDGL